MLTPEYLQTVADPITAIWEEINIWIVKDLCREIVYAGDHMTGDAAWKIYKMQQLGITEEQIRHGIQTITGLSDTEIEHLFTESGQMAYRSDLDLFRRAGVISKAEMAGMIEAWGGSAAMQRIQNWVDRTRGELRNFTGTLPAAGYSLYGQECDRAWLKVTSGAYSKEDAIADAVERAAGQGIYITYPSGHRDTIETCVRRSVTTGISRGSAEMTQRTCVDMGCNCVLVSSHLGARVSNDPVADHAGWQGKVYRLDDQLPGFYGKTAGALEEQGIIKIWSGGEIAGVEFPSLRVATGYPDDPRGLAGYNCRHQFYPFLPGVSENHMPRYDSEDNRRRYDETQEQRRMEREMRKTNRAIQGLKAAEDAASGNSAQAVKIWERMAWQEKKLRQQEAVYYAYCKKHSLPRQMERTLVAGQNAKKLLGN